MDASLAYWLIPLILLALLVLSGIHSAHLGRREGFGNTERREGFGNTERREGFENDEEGGAETDTYED